MCCLDVAPQIIEIFTQESFFPEFVGPPLLNCWSKVKGTSLILICTMMHQHSLWPGSIRVCQHLVQPVRVNRLSDMTCPTPVIELLAICLPWLSCCHISVNLIVAAVHHILIKCDKGIMEHFLVIMGFFLCDRASGFFEVLWRPNRISCLPCLPAGHLFCQPPFFLFCWEDLIHTHSANSE